MSDDLIQTSTDVLDLITTNNIDKTQLAKVVGGGGFIPYMQLMGGNTRECKSEGFPIGHFALVENKEKIDLGDTVLAMLCEYRIKAMQYKPDVLSFYDFNSPEFQNIKLQADVPNSNKGYGPEFLLWLPEKKKFCTFFFGNKTLRNEAPRFVNSFDERSFFCKISVQLIEDKKRDLIWHGVRYKKYDLTITLPDQEQLVEVLDKFRNPVSSKVKEKAEDNQDRG